MSSLKISMAIVKGAKFGASGAAATLKIKACVKLAARND